MSRIDDLVAELCPNGVPVHRLGDIATMLRGNGMPKSMLLDAGVGAIHYGQIYTKYGTWAEETLSFVSEDDAEKLTKADPGDLIITNTSENLEDVGKAVAWLGESQIVTGGHATVVKHKFEPKFLAYWFQTPEFYTQKKKLATGTKVIDVSAKKLEQVIVPVPPLEIQREIVRILDTFSKMEAELEAELEARKQQYEHYRDRLVGRRNFVSGEWTELAVVASIRTGSKPMTISDTGNFPYINAGNEPSGFTNNSNAHGGTVTIPSRGQGGAGHVGFQKDDFWCGPLCYRVETKSSAFINKFLYYYLRNIQEELVGLRKVGSIPAVNKSDLGKVKVPMPDIEDQQRIVDLLDKFDVLVNDLSVGLPAELAARRLQYEHYRDKLLTFKELEVAS